MLIEILLKQGIQEMSSVENKLKIHKVGIKGFGLQRSKFARLRLDFFGHAFDKAFPVVKL